MNDVSEIEEKLEYPVEVWRACMTFQQIVKCEDHMHLEREFIGFVDLVEGREGGGGRGD